LNEIPPPLQKLTQEEKVHFLTVAKAVQCEMETAVMHPSKTVSDTKKVMFSECALFEQSENVDFKNAARRGAHMK
jgi:hypothetical protein